MQGRPRRTFRFPETQNAPPIRGVSKAPDERNQTAEDQMRKRLAEIAAEERKLDETLACRAYEFSTFEANGDSEGYFVFDCDCEGHRAPPVVSDLAADLETTAAVMTGCFYVGYVRCDH